jgi:cytochrome c biogenesis protein CcmG, thiol:disulfide interchange protein DsbE
VTSRWLPVLVLLLAACTGGTKPQAGPSPAAAFFDPCPTVTSTAKAAHGLQDIELRCLGKGPRVNLSRLRGPMLVNVWASWCEPCQAEVPELQAFYIKAKGKVGLLGIDFTDGPASAQDFAGHIGMTYPSVVDADGETHFKSFLAAGPPETIFVAADGSVAFRKTGPFEDLAEIERLVREHLGVSV